MAERTLKEYSELRTKLQEKIQKEGFSDLEFIGETYVGFLYKYEDMFITTQVVLHLPTYDPTEHFEMKRRLDEVRAKREEKRRNKKWR